MGKERAVNARKRKRGGFTTVVNPMLDDNNLSLEAKGLLTIFLSNDQEQFNLNMKEVFSRSTNGRDKQYNAINELILEGYFCRIHVSNQEGKHEEVIYIYSDQKEHVLDVIQEESETLTKEGKRFWVESPASEKFYAKKFPKKISVRVEEIRKEYQEKGILPYPEFQDTVKNDQKPFPEKPDTEKPDTENQYNKNTKEKNTKGNNTNSRYVGSPSANPVFDLFKENYQLSKYAKDRLKELIEKHGEALVIEALKRAIWGEARKPVAYITSTLRKWLASGVTVVEDIKAHEEAHRHFKKKPASKPRKMDKLPVAVQQQIEQSQKEAAATQVPMMSEEERKEKEDQIRAKLKAMNESLHNWHQKQSPVNR